MNNFLEKKYTMPAEWESHSAIWLAWPFDETTFPERVAKVEKVFTEIIKSIYEFEQVKLLVLDQAMLENVAILLKNSGVDTKKIDFIKTKFADVWIRDYGPIFVVDRKQKKLAWIKWQYNGYGKGDDPFFSPILIDNDVFNKLDLGVEKLQSDLVLEGGSIDVNGEGVLLTTKQCLLNPNRNPNLNQEQIEKNLKDYLGVTKIIWLAKGLTNDHTDGHVDDIARFVDVNKIVCAYEDDMNDENFEILEANYQALKFATDNNGKSFEVIKLPMPHMNYDDGQKAPVSYCNFYIGNQVVLVPTYQDPNDEKALEILKSCFPDREVVGIDCSDVIYGGGAIHCMSQQQPEI